MPSVWGTVRVSRFNWLRSFTFDLNENCNQRQNIYNRIEKSSKIGQGKKSLISTCACFVTAIAKV